MIDSDDALEARFTLESERGGAVEAPPFQLLALGDWSGDADKKPLADRRPIAIDRDNFDNVLAKFAPRLVLTQENADPITLEFGSLDDFHPDHIFEQLPMFTRLRDLRKGLLSSDDFNSAAGEVRSWLKISERKETAETATAEAAATPVESDNLLDAILSGSTAAAPAPKAAGVSSEIADLVSGLVRPHLVSVDENEQSALLAAVDAATSELMQLILHDHRFQALEAAWRGLYLLVRRTETDTGLKIFVLDISHTELSDDLKGVSDLSDSYVYEILVDKAVDTPGADPWAVVIGNYAFQPVKDDVAALMRIAKVAAAANAPFISHVRPDVIGVRSLAEHRDASEWDLSTNSNEGRLWAVLRGIPEAGYLGMTMPRFLARLPYGSETEPLETFQFEEFSGAPEHDKFLWANTCFIAGLLMAQTYTELGWEMNQRFMQDVERLPMFVYENDGETVYQPCAEVLLTQTGCEKLMDHGLMPLVSYKNTDHVKLARFQAISDPVKGLKGRWN